MNELFTKGYGYIEEGAKIYEEKLSQQQIKFLYKKAIEPNLLLVYYQSYK